MEQAGRICCVDVDKQHIRSTMLFVFLRPSSVEDILRRTLQVNMHTNSHPYILACSSEQSSQSMFGSDEERKQDVGMLIWVWDHQTVTLITQRRPLGTRSPSLAGNRRSSSLNLRALEFRALHVHLAPSRAWRPRSSGQSNPAHARSFVTSPIRYMHQVAWNI